MTDKVTPSIQIGRKGKMKKLFLIVILVLFVFASTAFTQEHLRSSGLLTSDSSVVSARCLFYGVEIITNGSSDATAIVYDSSTASGVEAFKGKVTASSNFGGVTLTHPIEMFNGIYVDITGTGAGYIIYWKNK